MYEVTCFNCGNIAHITPDADRCIICGADLKHLIRPDYASKYFYQRAAQLADAGEVTLALLEVERGLRYHASSELHLLAAILSQQVSNFDQMRQHVAAIPVDDALRGEAEWLLRANQAHRHNDRTSANPVRVASTTLAMPTGLGNARATAVTQTPRPPLTGHLRRVVASTLLLLVTVFAAWVGLGPGAQLLNSWWRPGLNVNVDQPASASLPQSDTSSPNSAPTGPNTQPGQAASGLAGSAVLTVTVATPAPLLPTPTVEPIVASTPQTVLQATAGSAYDLQGYLQKSNQPELANLQVAATLQGVTLTLQGIVPMFIQRQTLLELARQAPAVGAVNAIDLLVRVPATYTVQAGDSLWSISSNFYGENRVAAIFAANRESLADPGALRLGQVLQMPPSN